MRSFILLFALAFSVSAQAQLPHGTVYGTKPGTAGMMDASKVDAYMGTKTSVSTTIKGRIITVTKEKGGWFELDAGNGKIINAHFKNYNTTIPTSLKGHTVILEGIAQRQFIADSGQHFAGNNPTTDKKQANKQSLVFEVSGMMVE